MADPTPVLITQLNSRAELDGTERFPNQRDGEAIASESTVDAIHDYRWHEDTRAPLETDNAAAGYGLHHYWVNTADSPPSVYLKVAEVAGVAAWVAQSVAAGGAATAIQETEGPTNLAIAEIPDGTFLRRVGSEVVGVGGVGSVVEVVSEDRTIAEIDNGKVLVITDGVDITAPAGLTGTVVVSLVSISPDDVHVITDGTSTLTPATVTIEGGSDPKLVQLFTVGSDNWLAVFVGNRQEDIIMLAASDRASDLVALPDRAEFRLPFAFQPTKVRAHVEEAPSGQPIIVDVNADTTSILSTKVQIDADELSSVTSSVTPVLDTTPLADNALITVDLDQVGSTNAGKGLTVYLYGYRV